MESASRIQRQLTLQDRRTLCTATANSGGLARQLHLLDFFLQMKQMLGFMGLAQLSYSNKSQENLKSPYKWMAKG
jgi:hypothetical protein